MRPLSRLERRRMSKILERRMLYLINLCLDLLMNLFLKHVGFHSLMQKIAPRSLAHLPL